ncbi:hypothetical protein BDV97DRAFT_371252 [Delphinella strobiligena]|nr:hypothetical protein BDV97DRAFT_371252 [Delphinella strobiligena]
MDAPLSVGFECELKLAFEAQELCSAVPTVNDLVIIKDHDPVIGQRAALGQYRDKEYRNWGLSDPANPFYPEETSLQAFKKPNEICSFRMYKDEPLKLVQHVLQAADIKSTIHSDLSAKQHDFSQAPWSIQRDASLQGLTLDQKISSFPRTVTTIEQANDVDCYGVELVSWPLTSAASARDNVSRAAEALLVSLKHGFVADVETGMHAHVGHVDGTPFVLPVLQNLFLLVVLFEDELSSLHSQARRRGAENPEIESNRVEFLADGAEEVYRAVPDSANPGQTISRQFYQNFMSITEIERKIFEEVDNATDPQARFRQLTGSKQHQVNFSYCFRQEGAATVEFRQHDGTFDSDTVFHWYHHCRGLVALAQRYAREGVTVTQRLNISTWDSRIQIQDLWEEMDLPLESRAFYRTRIATFKDENPLWEPFPPVWELIEEFDDFDEPEDPDQDKPETGEEDEAYFSDDSPGKIAAL